MGSAPHLPDVHPSRSLRESYLHDDWLRTTRNQQPASRGEVRSSNSRELDAKEVAIDLVRLKDDATASAPHHHHEWIGCAHGAGFALCDNEVTCRDHSLHHGLEREVCGTIDEVGDGFDDDRAQGGIGCALRKRCQNAGEIGGFNICTGRPLPPGEVCQSRPPLTDIKQPRFVTPAAY